MTLAMHHSAPPAARPPTIQANGLLRTAAALLACLLVVFSPVLRVGGGFINVQWLLVVVVVGRMILRGTAGFIPWRGLQHQGLGLFVVLLLMTVSAAGTHFVDRTAFIWILQAVASYTVATHVLADYRGSSAQYRRVANLLGWAAAINSAFIIVQLLWPNALAGMSRLLVQQSDVDAMFNLETLRPRGISGYGGATLSAVLAMMVTLDWIFAPHTTWRARFGLALRSMLSFAGIAIVGRTGFFLLLLGLVCMAAVALYNRSRPLAMKAASMVSLAVSVFVLLFLGVLVTSNEQLERAGKRAFEFVFRYDREGRLVTNSTETLFAEHLFLPDNADLILGDGNFGRNPKLPGIPSDSGYVRMISGCGILGCAAWLLLTLRGVEVMRKSRNAEVIAFAFFYACCVFSLNLKEPFIAGTLGFSFFSAFMLILSDDASLHRRAARSVVKTAPAPPSAHPQPRLSPPAR